MKIFHLVHSQKFAGSEQLALTLAKEQVRQGHDVSIIYRWGKDFSRMMEVEGGGVKSLRISKHTASLQLLYQIVKYKPDIVHCHLYPSVANANSVSRFTGTRFVSHLHMYESNTGYTKFSNHGNLIAVSEEVHSFYKDQMHVPLSNMTKIFNGTDAYLSSAFKEEKLHARASLAKEFSFSSEEERWLLLPGRLAPVKGHHILLEALEHLSIEGPPFRVIFCGYEDKPEYFEKLQAMAAISPHKDRITFCGWRHDVLRWMRAADVVVVPSLIEPFGLVAIESMMMETPVVAAQTGGLAEISSLCTSVTGFESENSEQLAKVLSGLLNEPEKAINLGKLGRAQAMENYSSKIMAERVSAYYRKILES